jgi:hypothetical protein
MATHEERRVTDGVTRRGVLRGGLLVGVGVATAGVASAAFTGNAKAVSPQPDWAFCSGCHAMWYTGNKTSGACPALAGGHAKAGSHIYQLTNNVSGGGYQPNWRWCSQCQGLFTTLHTPSFCPGSPIPGGGPHKEGAGSFDYDLDQPAPGVYISNPQSWWNWCSRCQGLYYQGSSGTTAGTCPDPNITPFAPHTGKGSDNYCIYWNGNY